MVAHQINSSGTCTSCQVKANEAETMLCFDCKSYYHGVCDNQLLYCTKSFLTSFKKVKSCNFIFVCDVCLTRRENQEASNIKDQIEALANTVSNLANEFKSFKAGKEEQEETKSTPADSNVSISVTTMVK